MRNYIVLGFFLVVSTLSTNGAQVCSPILSEGPEGVFVEVVISLFENGKINISDMEGILEDPTNVPKYLSEDVSVLPLRKVLLEVLASGMESKAVRADLSRYLEGVQGEKESRARDKETTKHLIELREVPHKDLLKTYQKEVVRVRWKGMEVIALTAVQGWEYFNDKLILFDPTVGKIVDVVKVRESNGLTKVFDSVKIGNKTLLLMSDMSARRTQYGSQSDLIIFELESRRVLYKIPMRSAPEGFRFYQAGKRLMAVGVVHLEKAVRVIDIRPRLRSRTIKVRLTPRLPRRRYFREGTFMHKGELHLAFVDWSRYYVMNVERSRIVLSVEFTDKLGPPSVVLLRSGRHVVFLPCKSSQVYVFDPMNPELAKVVEGVVSRFYFGGRENIWIRDEEGRKPENKLVWTDGSSLIDFNLNVESAFEDVFDGNPVPFSKRLWRSFTWWDSFRGKVVVSEKLDVPFSSVSDEVDVIKNVWTFVYSGRRYFVLNGRNADTKNNGLFLIDSTNGSVVDDIEFSNFPSSGDWFENEDGLFLILLGSERDAVKTYQVIRKGMTQQ